MKNSQSLARIYLNKQKYAFCLKFSNLFNQDPQIPIEKTHQDSFTQQLHSFLKNPNIHTIEPLILNLNEKNIENTKTFLSSIGQLTPHVPSQFLLQQKTILLSHIQEIKDVKYLQIIQEYRLTQEEKGIFNTICFDDMNIENIETCISFALKQQILNKNLLQKALELFDQADPQNLYKIVKYAQMQNIQMNQKQRLIFIKKLNEKIQNNQGIQDFLLLKDISTEELNSLSSILNENLTFLDQFDLKFLGLFISQNDLYFQKNKTLLNNLINKFKNLDLTQIEQNVLIIMMFCNQRFSIDAEFQHICLQRLQKILQFEDLMIPDQTYLFYILNQQKKENQELVDQLLEKCKSTIFYNLKDCKYSIKPLYQILDLYSDIAADDVGFFSNIERNLVKHFDHPQLKVKDILFINRHFYKARKGSRKFKILMQQIMNDNHLNNLKDLLKAYRSREAKYDDMLQKKSKSKFLANKWTKKN